MPADEQQPLLSPLPTAAAVPPVDAQPGVLKMASTSTKDDDVVLPTATFANARHDARKRRLPQCISHRGYQAKYPENTLAAFKGAVKAGTHALEMDVHITKDDVVVISHDAALKRCFGQPDKIADKTWEELKSVRTIAEPHEPMPRLQDVLEYLAQPGLEEIWVLLDIKLDNDADTIMRLVGSTISAAAPSSSKAWNQRIVLGIWAAKYLPLAQKYLPGFPVSHIGVSIGYARHFFSVPSVSFNMLVHILLAPGGRRFLHDAQQTHRRQVFAWTVNEEDRMIWCIRHGLDGVITDDPAKFLRVCDGYDEAKKEGVLPISLLGLVETVRIWVWITVMFWFAGKKMMPVASRQLLLRRDEAK